MMLIGLVWIGILEIVKEIKMYKVYKYSINIVDEIQVITLPIGAKILSFQLQGVQPTIWILLNIEEDRLVDRKFVIKSTGQPIMENIDNLIYIATTQQGMFVWHLFEAI